MQCLGVASGGACSLEPMLSWLFMLGKQSRNKTLLYLITNFYSELCNAISGSRKWQLMLLKASPMSHPCQACSSCYCFLDIEVEPRLCNPQAKLTLQADFQHIHQRNVWEPQVAAYALYNLSPVRLTLSWLFMRLTPRKTEGIRKNISKLFRTTPLSDRC